MNYGLSLNSTPDWEKIQQYLAQLQQSQAPANFQSPAPQGYQGPMPEVYPGGANVPLGGGFSAEGQYRKENSMSPAEWAAMLRYKRGF